jgi:hypothetical protein
MVLARSSHALEKSNDRPISRLDWSIKARAEMPVTPKIEGKTRSFCRVLGPFLVIVPGIIAARASQMDILVAAFFQNEAVVWMTGGFLLLAGLVTIAHHQYWSSVAAVLISLFGWLLVLEGLILLIAPALNAYAAADLVASTTFIRTLFSLLALAGLWLTYVGWVAKFISPDSSNVGKQHR